MLKKLLVLLSLTLFLIQTPFADSVAPICPCRGQINISKIADALQLTKEQRDKIKAIKMKYKETSLNNRAQLNALDIQIRNLTLTDNLDEAKMDYLIKQKTTIWTSMMRIRILMRNQVFKMLSSEQQTQFKELLRNWEQAKTTRTKCACDTTKS